MAYIAIEYGGKKTFGGYLSVDGDKQMILTEGLLIKVGAGTHNLEFMSVPSANKKILDANVYAGNVATVHMMTESWVEGTITERLEENDLLTLTVVSDNNGKILDLPTYQITSLDEEGMKTADQLYQEQAAEGIQADGSNVKTEFFLCLFLGWLGAHKFYRRKFIVGLLYLLTFGFGTILWILDTIILLVKVLSLKKKAK